MELIKTSWLLLYIIQLSSIAFFYSSTAMKIHKRIKRITDDDLKDLKENRTVPYLIRLDYKDQYGKHFLCSGALLSSNFVLTAAHCVTEFPIEAITVRGEQSLIKSHVEPHRVTNISTPRDYGEHFKSYDIAILKIEPPFRTDGVYISPIELSNTSLKKDDQLQVSGYQRHLVNTTYMPWRQCSKFYNGNVDIAQHMFCGAPERHTFTCTRDAGGPVVRDGKLCGIVLWSAGWINSAYPEVYMSTSSVKRFIEYTLAEV